MKKALAILFVNLVVPLVLLANDFTLNKGYVNNKGFYVSVPFETQNDLIILNVSLNGHPKKFLLDTGAPTAISSSLQKQFDFGFFARLGASDINGNSDSFTAISVDELNIGGMSVKDVPALVVSNKNPIFRHLDIDGIIGSNFLRHMIVRISVKDKTITFTDNIELLNLEHAYAEYMSTDKDMQSSPVIKVHLGDDITEELLFDTGFSGFYDLASVKFSMFSQHDDVNVMGVEKDKAMYGMMGVEKPTEKYKVLIPRYTVGGFVFHNVIAYTSSDDNSKLGAKFLRTADVTLDYVNNKFYMQPYTMAGTAFGDYCCMDAYYCKTE
ncbi:MAG: clan AA aspartic protease [Chitinophagaceae bacterium]|nr:clan AA aspartic protease [Chitinophagaceae bacterium]MCB9046682.1 clan AA aspartic protease [Chitinophagales bacterium]